MTQPNILLVMADQLSAPFLQPYGGQTVLSPNINRLAEEGVTFRSAYSNSPLCAPARFAMMSGQLNSRIGAYDNASEFPSSIPTFAHHLRAAGYQTSLAGKMHFVGPDQLHGFEQRLTTDIYPADFGWTPNWDDPDGRFDWWFHNMDSVRHAGVADVSNQLDYDDNVGFVALRKLRDLARAEDERPWLLTVSFTHPHDPYVARHEFWDLYEDVDIPLPTTPTIDLNLDDPHSKRLRHVIGSDQTAPTTEQVLHARRAYFANISYIDHWLGQMLTILSRHNLSDTVIIFTSDHGDMLGERGLWYKMSFFEHSARVPLIVHNPERFDATEVSANVSLVDLAPTLVDLAGASRPARMDGESLLPLMREPKDQASPRTVVGEYLGEGAVAPIFMLLRDRWKFVWCAADPPQLYNLDADPEEVGNLATDPAHAALVDELTVEIHQRWDVEQVRADVVASQQARAEIDRALRRGRFTSWDFQPSEDAASQYMRNHLDLNQVEAKRRR